MRRRGHAPSRPQPRDSSPRSPSRSPCSQRAGVAARYAPKAAAKPASVRHDRPGADPRELRRCGVGPRRRPAPSRSGRRTAWPHPTRRRSCRRSRSATGTRVVASDPLTGVPRWSHDIAGTWRVRVVSPGGRIRRVGRRQPQHRVQPRGPRPSSTSRPRAARASCGSPATSIPRRSASTVASLYALDFLPAMNPTRYSVRKVDLAHRARSRRFPIATARSARRCRATRAPSS